MKNLTVQQKVNTLWARGYNPIRLFGNIYLVRHEPSCCSKLPLYTVKNVEKITLDKM